ncbi:MAG: spore coat associated protein CotJA [Clostridia bacterium]|nr:spore coat associated protein CotJA [Clostridia bacterium]
MPCGRRTATGDMYVDNGMSEHACDDMVLAMAYVLAQQWNTLFEIEEGFARGTIYPELDKPFMGGGCSCGV